MAKIIHYCWFGGKPLPKLAKKCIKSWEKYLPDYEIRRWDESNFDVNITEFSKKAYEEKKWAFVSDVARVYALKEYGGIYFDTDMMVVKDVDFLKDEEFFAGWESKDYVAVGALGAKNPDNPIINDLVKKYELLSHEWKSDYRTDCQLHRRLQGFRQVFPVQFPSQNPRGRHWCIQGSVCCKMRDCKRQIRWSSRRKMP